MKRRTWPLWFLRDVPALLGVVLSFWPLVIVVIANGAKAMRGRKISPAVYQHLMAMLPVAEAQLQFALQRQAYRAFGWSVRAIRRDQIVPLSDWNDFIPRFEAYRLAIMDLDAASRAFTQSLRHAYRIRTRVDATAVHGGPARAAHLRDAPTAATPHHCNSRGALILRRPKAVSKDAGGLTNARGPPQSPRLPIADRLLPPKRPLPRTRRHAHSPPRQPGLGSPHHGDPHAQATRAFRPDRHHRLRHRPGRCAAGRHACSAAADRC